jgi:hypothetical protein
MEELFFYVLLTQIWGEFLKNADLGVNNYPSFKAHLKSLKSMNKHSLHMYIIVQLRCASIYFLYPSCMIITSVYCSWSVLCIFSVVAIAWPCAPGQGKLTKASRVWSTAQKADCLLWLYLTVKPNCSLLVILRYDNYSYVLMHVRPCIYDYRDIYLHVRRYDWWMFFQEVQVGKVWTDTFLRTYISR